MATGGNEIASDEIPDFQCMSCDNRTVVKYCVDCQGYCCQACVDIHSRFPIMKGHTLLDKSNLQTSTSPGSKPAKLPLVPTERCDIHTIKVLDMYCGDHDVVGCTTCMALDHRSCNNVHSIPEDIDLLFDSTNLHEVSEKLQKGKETLENIEKRKDELLEGLLASKEEAVNKIKNAKLEIIEAAENMEKKSLEEVENVYQEEKTSIQKERKDAIDTADSISKVSDRLTASKGNKAQQFVCLKIGQKKIKHVKEVETLLAKEKEAKINFVTDPNIQNCFRNMTTFGKTNIKSVKKQTDLYIVEKCVDMNVRLSQDTSPCSIWGSCLTEDGSLLMVDISNKKLKRANINTVAVDAFCNFDVYPYCVCCTSRQEAVVTFYIYDIYIQFVTLSKQLTPSRKVKISHHCLGISCKDDKLYIADYCRSVYIHDMNGNQLQVISCDSSGNCLFSSMISITFSDTINGVIVGDWSKGVIILDGEFQRVASFSDNDLSCTHAVCTDRRGNIFACGYNSHNVMQIGYDGKKRGVIVSKSDGLNYPESVCFDSSQSKLIVTQRNDIVKIFDLK